MATDRSAHVRIARIPTKSALVKHAPFLFLLACLIAIFCLAVPIQVTFKAGIQMSGLDRLLEAINGATFIPAYFLRSFR